MSFRLLSRPFLPLAAVLVCMVPLLTSTIQAGAPKKPREHDYKQYFDEISSVDTTANTVTVATMVQETPFGHPDARKPAHQEKTTTYKITTTSKIEVGGKQSDLKALNKGMKVAVSKGADENTLDQLIVKP